ncbi:uncharacterized protein F4807DRAFT_472054 [Annulohypoxylon truncatum]|uniref:uncharacterized protein n=1 Tax=Annulohypoxylon truncatum TaxID=327061 RepID=UPI002007E9DF|nr:uncharacterized protein F4807DRAFT_472054 [Annulohypoxylon truncatum]KAI1204365.1 hypothetical protein F4807DRAFT_472054 [Annulohypoxylon truncatum]
MISPPPAPKLSRSWSTPVLHSTTTTTTQPLQATTDLETYTYTDPHQRTILRSLSTTYSDRNSSTVGFAPKYREIRRNGAIIAFVDAARAFDQELLALRFVLAGPRAVDYLAPADVARAETGLRRANAVLARGGWVVRRCEDLWAAQYACESLGEVIRDRELLADVDIGKQDAELACHRFWQQAKERFIPLIWILDKEAKRMKRVVSRLERNREPPFLRELRRKKVRSPLPAPIPAESASTSTNTLSSSSSSSSTTSCSVPHYQMRGALPVVAAAADAKTTTRLNKLRAQLAKSKTRNALGIDFAYLALKARYRVLETRDKMRGGRDPAASRAMWLAFREALRKHPGPPSCDLICLEIKTDTMVLLAGRRIGGDETQVD